MKPVRELRSVISDRGRVNLDENKTDDPRDWDLRPDVVLALTRWKKLCASHTEADDYVFAEGGVPLNVEHLANQLRRDLWRVGVRRPQLHENTKGRQRIRAHDLRATFVTVSLATGKTETWISDRTGHRSHAMIETYRRRSRTWNVGELAPLHERIPELSPLDWAANGQRLHRTGGEIGRRSGFRFPDEGAAATEVGPVDDVDAALACALREATAALDWRTVRTLARAVASRSQSRRKAAP